jgi:serine/threonine protein kinase
MFQEVVHLPEDFLSEIATLIGGKYDVIKKIREGGMGTIYKVRHRLLEEIRVVKVMRQSVGGDEELRRRFLEEAKTATRLKHPNIATIYDFALGDDGTAYLVMEFIDGVTLGEILKSQGSVGLALSLEIAHQTLLALGYLHRKSVIHRDIAPDNLMLTYDEEGNSRIKLIDLGIAKVLGRNVEMTSTGVFLGKVRYASPEQYGSLAPSEVIDGRSDLYSLGLVLYELLTGRRPFLGETPVEILRAHVLQEPTSFSVTDPEGLVPEEVRAAVLKALQKRREDRFSTSPEFDREILALRSRFTRPFEIDPAQAIISLVRGSPVVGTDPVTPSAQDRLDRHFLAHPTPVPPTTPRGPRIPDTVVDVEAKDALLLMEIRERESRGDLHGLESLAQASPESGHPGQAAREAIRRLNERARGEKREEEEADWRECEAQGSEAAWQGYLDRHPDSFRHEEASRRLTEALAFLSALENGTSRVWNAFLEQWPQSPRREEAARRFRESCEREEAALVSTVIGARERQARLLNEIQEREREGDVNGLRTIIEVSPAGSRVEQAAQTAILRIQEREAQERREAEEEDWRKSESENSVEAWQGYLGRYPESQRREEAVQRLSESRAFGNAVGAATSQAWSRFLSEWPQGSHREEADLRAREAREREDAALADAARIGTANSYRDFLEKHPDSYVATVAQQYLEERLAFESAQRQDTVRSWQEFQSHWPSGRLSLGAAAALEVVQQREADALKAAIEAGTSGALRKFLGRFPDAGNRSRAEAALQETLAFEAAGREGKAGWERFLETYPDGSHNAAARTVFRRIVEKEAEDQKRQENETLLLEIRHCEEARREAELESLAEKHSDNATIAGAARAALRRLQEVRQREKAAEQAREALRLKLEAEQERREAAEREREAEKLRELAARREREVAKQRQREAEEREREAAKQRELEARRLREAAKQRQREAEEREREAAEQRELEARRQREAAKQRQREAAEREREAAKLRELEAGREREEASRLLREAEERDREEAKQRKLEVKREREEARRLQQEKERSDRAARAALGVAAVPSRRQVGLAAVVLIAGAGIWFAMHRPVQPRVEAVASPITVPAEPAAPPLPATGTAPASAGTLVIDAFPWGEVIRVQDSDGKNWLSGKPEYTPMSLDLPPGKYTVVMKNGNFPEQTPSAEVAEGASISCVGIFERIDPAAYLEMEGLRR